MHGTIELAQNSLELELQQKAARERAYSLPLAELDPGFTSNDILVADTLDGKALFASQGPLRVIAPKDSRAARSVRMLQRLEVVRLKK